MRVQRPSLPFPTHHDDSGWCGCSCNHGVYCGYYREYGDCLSHTAGICYVVIGGYGAMPRYSSTGVDGGGEKKSDEYRSYYSIL